MTAFTIITGVATLIGFFIQIKGLLPNYRQYFAAATYLLFGVTLGFGAASLSQIEVTLKEALTARNFLGIFLFGGSGVLVFICFVASTFIKEQKRRSEISRLGSAVSGFLVFLVIFFSSFCFPATSDESGKDIAFTYDEKIVIGIEAAKRHNFDRALAVFGSILSSLPGYDERSEGLKSLIKKTSEDQKVFFTNSMKQSAVSVNIE
jgi:hypothetical protein